MCASIARRLILAIACAIPAMPSVAGEGDPLFASNETLRVTLRAPYKEMVAARDKSIRYTGAAILDQDTYDIEVRVRGNSRLRRDTCRFPPMSIKFDRNQAGGTIFDGQKKLKLVNACDPRSKKSRTALAKEYLAYRMLNTLTPNSFRVRMLDVDYVDPTTGDTFASPAFVIENKKRLANRLDMSVVSIDESSATEMDSRHLNLVSLFQLMIGNVDWSATHGGNDECCHNFKLIREDDLPIIAIPYDFDRSGLVNPSYATPLPEFGQRSVTDRRYRGYCRNNTHLEENTTLLNNQYPQLLQVIDETPILTERDKVRVARYVDSFFKIINSPRRVKGVIEKWCNKSTFVVVDATATPI